jgi:hypothetical protein
MSLTGQGVLLLLVNLAVQVAPLTVDPLETTALVQDVPVAAMYVLGAELDDTRGVVRTAGIGVDDLQPAPRDGLVEAELGGAGVGMPGDQQVADVTDGEGAEP